MDHPTALHREVKAAQAQAERHGHADALAAMTMASMAAQDGGAAPEAPLVAGCGASRA